MEEMNYQAFWKFIKLLYDNNLLEQHTITVPLFDMNIMVPTPEAYAVHKLEHLNCYHPLTDTM